MPTHELREPGGGRVVAQPNQSATPRTASEIFEAELRAARTLDERTEARRKFCEATGIPFQSAESLLEAAAQPPAQPTGAQLREAFGELLGDAGMAATAAAGRYDKVDFSALAEADRPEDDLDRALREAYGWAPNSREAKAFRKGRYF